MIFSNMKFINISLFLNVIRFHGQSRVFQLVLNTSCTVYFHQQRSKAQLTKTLVLFILFFMKYPGCLYTV